MLWGHEAGTAAASLRSPIYDGTCAPEGEIATWANELAEEYANHDNYRTQWGLDAIRADTAYGNLDLLKGQGAGVTIGFVDTGIDAGHPAFAGKTVPQTEQGHAGHGTAVASVAAGVRSTVSDATHGVAWGADIAMFTISAGSGGGNYVPISLAGLNNSDATGKGLINDVLAWRDGNRKVDILNLSVGFHGIIDSYSKQRLETKFGDAIEAMAQKSVTDKTILVWAAGNAHGKTCDPADLPQCVNGVSVGVLPGLAARIAELRGHTIAVVALRPSDDTNNIPESIASFSNRCGIAADYCIAAPGQSVQVARYSIDGGIVTRDYRAGDGTSYAAPMVAGGLALMKQLFRDQLANTELVARLLKTANNRGRYAGASSTSAFALHAATAPADWGTMHFSVSQPLRVERGAGAVPVGAGGHGAQRPTDRRCRGMEPPAGGRRASPGRGVELPAGPRQGSRPGVGGDGGGGFVLPFKRHMDDVCTKVLSGSSHMRSVVGIVSFVSLIAASGPAHAYLDPGSVSLWIQGIVAALAGVALTWKHWCRRLRSFFGQDGKRKLKADSSGSNPRAPGNEDAPSDE